MKRIAIVTDCYGNEAKSGTSVYARMIAEQLANQYEVEVLTTRSVSDSKWSNWYARPYETAHGVTIRRFSVDEEDTTTHDKPIGPEKENISDILENTPKNLTVFPGKSSTFQEFIKRNYKKYACIFFVDYTASLTKQGISYCTDRAILIPRAIDNDTLRLEQSKEILSMPAGFVFCTDEERVMVRRRHQCTEPIPCQVAGTGVDTPQYVDPMRFRKIYGINVPYLLYVGRIEEEKGCPMLFRYFLELKKRFRGNLNLKLVLIGEQECRIPKDKDIIALGYLPEEDKMDAIAGAKAMVLPTEYDVLPRTAIEAMTLAVPLVVNGASTVLQGVCLESNGGLFYQNYFEFEGIVRFIMYHKNEYDVICTNAQEYCMQKYDWAEIMSRFDKIIQYVAK